MTSESVRDAASPLQRRVEEALNLTVQEQEALRQPELDVERRIEEAVRSRVAEALRLQEQEVERRIEEAVRWRVAEALRLQEQEAVRRKVEEALRQQEPKTERRIEEAVRAKVREARRELERHFDDRVRDGVCVKYEEVIRAETLEVECRVQEAVRVNLRETLLAKEEMFERRAQEAARVQIEAARRLQEEEADLKVREALRVQERQIEMRIGRAVSAQRRKTKKELEVLHLEVRHRGTLIHELRTTLDARMRHVQQRLAMVEGRLRRAVREQTERAGGQRERAAEAASSSDDSDGSVGDWSLIDYEAAGSDLDEAAPDVDEGVGRASEKSGSEEAKERTSGASPPVSTSAAPQPPTATDAVVDPEAAAQAAQRRLQVEQLVAEVCLKAKRASESEERLCVAAFYGKVEKVRRLLDSGVDVNCVSRFGRSPLISTFYFNGWATGDRDRYLMVSLLLERGADVDAVEVQGSTALHLAALYETVYGTVPLLLAAGAAVDARDAHGATPLHRAAFKGNAASLQVLLAAGADRAARCWGGRWAGKAPVDIARTDAARELLRQPDTASGP